MKVCSCVVTMLDTMIEQPAICGCDDAEQDDTSVLREHLISSQSAAELGELFKVLGDPNRLRIISLLKGHEVCVHTLEEVLGMSQSAISHQLKVLRQLKLVRSRREGRHIFYALDDAHVGELFMQALRHVEHQ